jgi:TonB-linked SusC/RagA family outer membrane protein
MKKKTGILYAYSLCLCVLSGQVMAQTTGQVPEKSIRDTGINRKTDSVAVGVNRTYIDVLHGRQPAGTIIQSISTVGSNQLLSTPSAQVFQALPGRLPGLNISFNSGAPGLDNSGVSGYSVRGARAQTVLIDGVQRGFTSLDPEQIESVSVLKDALSTVMFGQRSSNGIISIITKKGNTGKPRLSFSAQAGFSTPVALPKPLQAAQYATLYNEAKQNDATIGTTVTPQFSPADIAAYQNGTDPYGHPNVDWYKTILKKNAPYRKYNFNVQGSGQGFTYFVDLDYLKEGGLFKTIDSNVYNTNAQLDRYLVRSNVGVDVSPTTNVQLNLFGRIQKNNQPGGGTAGILTSLLNTPQNAYPVFNPNGSLGGSSQYGQNVNIYGQAVYRGYQFQDARDMAVDLQVKQRLDVVVPGLYLKVQGSYNNTTTYTTTRAKDFAVYQYNTTSGTYAKTGTTSEQGSGGAANDRLRVTYYEAALGYDHSFGKHTINATVLADQQSTLNYTSGNLPENYTDYAARVSYNWDERYLVEGAASYAGYNYFAPGNRFTSFWAGGIGWNMHKERFIKEHVSFISNLKLRATYGLTGQASTGYFTYIQTYWTPENNFDNNIAYYFGNGGSLIRSTGVNALANPNVRPEKAKKLNVGLDLGVLNNRLTFTGEYFRNRFYDLMGVRSRTTAILGTTFPSENLQKFNYWGTDISVTWQDHIKEFSYFITGNLSTVQSKVIFNDELPKQFDYQRTTGNQVGLQFGYVATGLYKDLAEINDPKTASPVAKSTLRPGDIRYLDRNSDGKIDTDDMGAIGSGKAVVYFGLNMGFSYKGLDVSVLFQGTQNRVSYLSGDFFNGFGNGGTYNAYEYNLGRWTPETAATAAMPRLSLGAANTNNQLTSSYWLQNTDFIRLKNAEIGYTLPAALTRRIGVPAARFFVNGLNLVTWSEIFKIRKDIDPEASVTAYPIMRVVNFGVNVTF